MPAENTHEETNESRVGSRDVLEDDHQANQNWLGRGEPKGLLGLFRSGKEAQVRCNPSDWYLLQLMVVHHELF